MNTLFPTKGDFRIVQLRDSDVWGESDHLKAFTRLILENEEQYPKIGHWLTEKVLSSLSSSERLAYVGYEGGSPVVSAVLKRGKHSKICHLRVKTEFQDIRLGEIFFALMAFECRNETREIHFTLPEQLWLNKQDFFEGFGFTRANKSKKQYRRSADELRCSAEFEVVWKAVLDKLPKLRRAFSVVGYSMDSDLVMSLKPKFARAIFSGKKSVEIRKVFSLNWEGLCVVIYASAPDQVLLGQARIQSVVKGVPERIWGTFGSNIGGAKEEFDSYVGSAKEVYAISLADPVSFQTDIPLVQVSHLVRENLKPPESYHALAKNEKWAKAVSVAALLHGGFGRKSVVCH